MRDNGGAGDKYRRQMNVPVTRQPYSYSGTVEISVVVGDFVFVVVAAANVVVAAVRFFLSK
jgi:hypothetical protein